MAAFAEAGRPLDPAKTLRPDLDESVDFDNTQNLFITGDNLEALKLLQESYLNKVDMIYIDPPYNTGHDFIYHDNFHRSQSDEIDDSRNDDGNRQYAVNSKENGRYHSDWLSMMYPRLMIARNLLSENGVIFISIDDSEQANLKLMCDEVFGIDNFICTFIWRRSGAGGLRGVFPVATHEYIVVYARNKSSIADPWFAPYSQASLGDFKYSDERGQYKTQALYLTSLKQTVNQSYPIETPDGTSVVPPDNIGAWRFVWEKFQHELDSGNILFKRTYNSPLRTVDGGQSVYNIYTKQYISESGTNPPTLLPDDLVGHTRTSRAELKSLFGGDYFSYAKPSSLIKYLMSMPARKNDVVLDCFAGSGTTADAVMQLNAEDGGHRKFIMVQLPEECSEKSEAYKAGYKTIDQLSRERIRRAAKKIKASDKNADYHDYGFRALYIDKANAKDDISVPADSLQQSQLSFQVDDIYADRSPLDLLFGVLAAKGWQLDGEIERRNINGNDVYLYDYVPGAGMVACFDNELTDEAINQIIDMHPQVAVFRETAFKQSDEKINLMERFKNDSSETRVWVI